MSNMSTMLVAFTFVLAACTMAWGQQGEYYESFEDGVPPYFTATRPESLRLSPWHSKQGSNSLRWDWAQTGVHRLAAGPSFLSRFPKRQADGEGG